MKRDREDGRDSQYTGKYPRGESGSRGRPRGPRSGQKGQRRPAGRGVDYAGYDFSSYSVPELTDDEVELKADINVKREMVGAIIGRGGNTVTRIRSNSGAHVHIREPAMGDNEQTVELRGTRDQVQTAADEIKDILTKEDEEYAQDNGNISDATIIVDIAPEMVGCLIGKGGQNVKNIRATTGSQVRVDSLQEGENVQAVNIHGSIDQVIEAFQMVAEILRGFDPRKSRLLRHSNDQAPAKLMGTIGTGNHMAANTSLVGMNIGGGVARAGALLTGGPASALTPGVVQPLTTANAGQQSFVIQTPAGGATGGPTILVLQPDGTFAPAPVIYRTLPTTPAAVATQATAGMGGVVQTDATTATAAAAAAVGTYTAQGLGAPGTATNSLL